MIKPVLKGDAFLRNVQIAGRSEDHLSLWWLGQSGFLVQWKGEHLLLDPYLSDSLTRKYADTSRPHVRMTELVVEPEKLSFIDVITSSHRHTDHLDRDTIVPILRSCPGLSVVLPEANRQFALDRLGCDDEVLVGLDDDASIQLGQFTLTGIPAAHEEIECDEEGRCLALGYIVQMGPWTLYHSGDTVVYDGLEQRLSSFDVDLALLPINGRDPERGVPGNMSGVEAARLASQIGARLVIPCHYDMFEFNTASPDEFVRECRRLDQPYRILHCGEKWNDLEMAEIAGDEDPQLDRVSGRNRSRHGEGEDY